MRETRKDRILNHLRGQAEPVSARSVAEALLLGHAETCAILKSATTAGEVVRTGIRNAYRYQIAAGA